MNNGFPKSIQFRWKWTMAAYNFHWHCFTIIIIIHGSGLLISWFVIQYLSFILVYWALQYVYFEMSQAGPFYSLPFYLVKYDIYCRFSFKFESMLGLDFHIVDMAHGMPMQLNYVLFIFRIDYWKQNIFVSIFSMVSSLFVIFSANCAFSRENDLVEIASRTRDVAPNVCSCYWILYSRWKFDKSHSMHANVVHAIYYSDWILFFAIPHLYFVLHLLYSNIKLNVCSFLCIYLMLAILF